MKATLQPGQVVRSRYRARWYGLVLAVEPCATTLRGRPHTTYLATVVIVLHANGQPARRRIVKRYNVFWFEPAPNRVLPPINPDWLILPSETP